MASLLDLAKAALAGFAMMVLEVAGARLLYPLFGSSMLIWASIIGTFMAVLAAGYYLGARISVRKDAEQIVGNALFASGSFVFFLPIIVHLLQPADIPWQILLLLASLLVSAPALSLSLVSPVLIEKSSKGHAGISAGTIYSVSTLGSIAGTFIPAFIMLPSLGVSATISASGMVMLACALLFLKSSTGMQKASFFVSFFLFFLYAAAQPFGIPTYFYTAHVVDSGGVRYLFLDGFAQSGLNLSDFSQPVFKYAQVMKEKMASATFAKRVAIIGAGGCSQVHHVKGLFPSASIDIVDIDKMVFGICTSKFFVEEGNGVKFHVEDGRKFLEANGGYDIIIVDAFSSGCGIPVHIGSSEFFRIAAKSLAPGGMLLANLIAIPGGKAHTVFCNTAKSAFESVSCEPAGSGRLENIVISATGPKSAPDFSRPAISDDLNPIELEYASECFSR